MGMQGPKAKGEGKRVRKRALHASVAALMVCMRASMPTLGHLRAAFDLVVGVLADVVRQFLCHSNGGNGTQTATTHTHTQTSVRTTQLRQGPARTDATEHSHRESRANAAIPDTHALFVVLSALCFVCACRCA